MSDYAEGQQVVKCFYRGSKIIFDEAVQSEKTNKHLPLNLDDATKHKCAAFYSVNNKAARGQGKQYSSVSKSSSLYYKR
jgi:hypothetical protein